MENAKIIEWLSEDCYHDSISVGIFRDKLKSGILGEGDGSGYGYAPCNGYGAGFGCGDGYSFYGQGYNGKALSVGGNYLHEYCCYGSGDGDGEGCGYGFCGYGNGMVIQNKCVLSFKSFNKDIVFDIDSISTIIKHIKGNVAKGYILYSDFTTEPCYVVKGNGYFAHGRNLREAQQALTEKYMADMDVDEVIDKFMKTFEHGKKYSGHEFFKWHNYLTGSCLAGRKAFVKEYDINLDDKFFVGDFIDICEYSYGSTIIKRLKERWCSQ